MPDRSLASRSHDQTKGRTGFSPIHRKESWRKEKRRNERNEEMEGNRCRHGLTPAQSFLGASLHYGWPCFVEILSPIGLPFAPFGLVTSFPPGVGCRVPHPVRALHGSGRDPRRCGSPSQRDEGHKGQHHTEVGDGGIPTLAQRRRLGAATHGDRGRREGGAGGAGAVRQG